MNKNKIISFLAVFVVLVSMLTVTCFADSFTTYADTAPSSTTCQNLINCAINTDTFRDSDYVCFQNAQYSYYIVWGDLSYSGNRVVGSNVDYIQYSRSGSGYDYVYSYDYGSMTEFNLTLDHVITSNIDTLGFSSSVYRDYISDFYQNYFYIFFGALLFVLALLMFRNVFK